MNQPFSSLLLHKQHAKIVGSILIAYGEIEFDVMGCLAEILGSATHALQVMFRVRSESTRIHIADAIMRPRFQALKIDAYDHFIMAVHDCIAVRNQYAHCHWNNDGKKLFFTMLEHFATPKVPPAGLKKHRINLDLLKKQQAYFRYAQEGLWYIQTEYEKGIGKGSSHPWPKPKEVLKPPKYIGQGIQVHPNKKKFPRPKRKAPKRTS